MATSTKSKTRKTSSKRKPTSKPKWTSRAVLRDVEAGSSVDCSYCDERVKFQAKIRNRQVICNVYVGNKWTRVEHFHAECYDEAKEPYGPIVGPRDQRKSPSPAAIKAKMEAEEKAGEKASS